MDAPHVRLGRYLDVAKLTKAEFARHLGCSDAFVGQVLSGEKLPGTGIAQAIERETLSWDEGAIATEEWAVLHDEKRHERTERLRERKARAKPPEAAE